MFELEVNENLKVDNILVGSAASAAANLAEWTIRKEAREAKEAADAAVRAADEAAAAAAAAVAAAAASKGSFAFLLQGDATTAIVFGAATLGLIRVGNML
jgi:hypothetical protein